MNEIKKFPFRLLYNRNESAELLGGMSLSKLGDLIRKGKIAVRRIDGMVLIHVTELDRFARGQERNPTPSNPAASNGATDNQEPKSGTGTKEAE